MTRPGRHSSAADGLGRVADYAGFALLWCWILISVFFVPVWLGYWWLGAVLFVLGLVVCWQAAEASHDPVTTVGTKRDVRTGRVDDEHVDCDECGRSAEGGEYRRYERRRVLFGTTIAVLDAGENVYCPQCLTVPSDRIELADDLHLSDGSGAGDGTADDPDGWDGTDLESDRA